MEIKFPVILGFVFFILLFFTPMVIAVDFYEDISDKDKETFDEILAPVMKIYNLIKYSATVFAVIILLFAGINYMGSGSNPAKREQSKNMMTYVVVGLLVIWAAPMIINFIVS